MSVLSSFFYPDLYVSSVYALPYRHLREKNIDALFFDIDNTLKPHYEKLPSAKLAALFRRLEKMGFKICLVSNGRKGRVVPFAGALGAQIVYSAKKPLLAGIKRARRMCGGVRRAAIVGDQIFTDILAGKRGKLYTVLVEPISKNENFFIRLRRFPERLVLRAYENEKPRIGL